MSTAVSETAPAATRPAVLFDLFADLAGLAGIGPRTRPLFAKLVGDRVIDLIWHLPSELIDRRQAVAVCEAEPGQVVRLYVTVKRHRPGIGKSPYRVDVADGTGQLSLVFFRARAAYLEKLLPVGAIRHVSGRVDLFGERLQMVHPDHITEEETAIPALEPVYPLTAGLSRRHLVKALDKALQRLPRLPEWLPPDVLAQHNWPDWRTALTCLHRPQGDADLARAEPARRRLAFDELYATQLAVQLVRARTRRLGGRALSFDGRHQQVVRDALPYRLTADQDAAIAAVQADMAADQAMLRLVQGDVGSGKTMVALFALLAAAEAGCQGVMLAPTELLARQHFDTLAPWFTRVGLRCALLTGRVQGPARQAVLADLAAGRLACLIGTHAVLQEAVTFKDLALAVIDEQHRFGVFQRLTLSRKGAGRVDLLVMTATPIPRTLTLAVYGDMDVSCIREKPPGRQPVTTRVVSLARLDEVVVGLQRAVNEGARAYWVCPLVADDEAGDGTAAETRYESLKRQLGDQVGLLHGRMKGPDKAAVMDAFARGALTVLVATTVIEVGVDVPEATIMIVEQAERFGLAQLHQLRGRVGRGGARSSCLLLRSAELSQTAQARLEVLRGSEDGFHLAEEDLRLRGPGDLIGRRQSGLPSFRLADLERDQDLMAMAHDAARLALARDPDLSGPNGEALRVLLYLFERDAAVRTLRSG
ncbi:MAG: ATP-dependent DNA helicase RecG [Rhodothalassiaceae bacterium]